MKQGKGTYTREKDILNTINMAMIDCKFNIIYSDYIQPTVIAIAIEHTTDYMSLIKILPKLGEEIEELSEGKFVRASDEMDIIYFLLEMEPITFEIVKG